MHSTGRSRPRRFLVTILAVATTSSSGCLGNIGQAPTQSVTSEAFGVDGATAQRTRLAALNTESSLLGLIELRADEIIAATDDAGVARNALRWKATAIPVLQRAAHHPDPLVSYVDEWTLLLQMRDYFETGDGRDLFGDQQRIAVDALVEMEEQLDEKLAEEIGPEGHRMVRTFVRGWATDHPIDNELFVRLPVSSAAARELGDVQLGGVAALGRLEELAMETQQMAQSYAAYTPKVTLWQAQLMIQDMLDTARVGPLLSQVDRLALTQAATRLMDELPELVQAERAATTAELAALTESSLVTLMSLASRERELVLAEVARMVRAERSALTEEVAETLVETLREGRKEAMVVIDHTLWRIALLAAALILVLAVLQFLLLRSYLARRYALDPASLRS